MEIKSIGQAIDPKRICKQHKFTANQGKRQKVEYSSIKVSLLNVLFV